MHEWNEILFIGAHEMLLVEFYRVTNKRIHTTLCHFLIRLSFRDCRNLIHGPSLIQYLVSEFCIPVLYPRFMTMRCDFVVQDTIKRKQSNWMREILICMILIINKHEEERKNKTFKTVRPGFYVFIWTGKQNLFPLVACSNVSFSSTHVLSAECLG